MIDARLVAAIRAVLLAHARPEDAPAMQAYMKSSMPFLGIKTVERQRLVRAEIDARPPADRATWVATVMALWSDAEYREERYAALQLTGHRSARQWQDPEALSLYRELIISGAWWDYVDEIASRRVGPILRAYARETAPVLRRWAVDDDLWLRRTAIIAQLGSKAATDTDLLAEVITNNLLDGPPVTRDFFIRKAVGWALRQHAKTDPEWVRRFVAEHRDRLSPLSVREALKHVAPLPE